MPQTLNNNKRAIENWQTIITFYKDCLVVWNRDQQKWVQKSKPSQPDGGDDIDVDDDEPGGLSEASEATPTLHGKPTILKTAAFASGKFREPADLATRAEIRATSTRKGRTEPLNQDELILKPSPTERKYFETDLDEALENEPDLKPSADMSNSALQNDSDVDNLFNKLSQVHNLDRGKYASLVSDMIKGADAQLKLAMGKAGKNTIGGAKDVR